MLDKKYNAQEKEARWLNYWNENKIYKFIPDGRKVFSIDTPPPTVNGKIHIGHIFSYSQTEMIARYKRLRGFNIFYPFGFDDNGLPSERLVEKEQGKKAHELILFYSIEISDENYQEEYKVIDDHGETIAKWIDIDEFKNKNKILYPEEVFKYI